jgi:hypothetical protein
MHPEDDSCEFQGNSTDYILENAQEGRGMADAFIFVVSLVVPHQDGKRDVFFPPSQSK